MSFWGPSTTQNQAQGWFPAQGNWNTQQYRDWLNQANTQANTGQQNQNWAAQYFQNRATDGMGNPDLARGYGEWIMPGVNETLDRQSGRLNGIGDDFNNTFQGARNRWDEAGGSINSNYDAGNNDINSTYGGMSGRSNDTSNDMIRNLSGIYNGVRGTTGNDYADMRQRSNDTYNRMDQSNGSVYGGLRGQASDTFGQLGSRADRTYGGLEGDSASTYGGLQGSNAAAFGQAQQNLNLIKPGGDAAAGRSARAFAPQVASTMGRLRAAGVDPNSAEASSVLGRVETGRSRAMDDAYAQNIDQYVGRKNDLTLGQEGVNRDLALGRLSNNQNLAMQNESIGRGLGQNQLQNDQGLAREQFGNARQIAQDQLGNNQSLQREQGGIDRDLQLGLGQQYRDLTSQNLGTQNSIDAARLGASTANRNNHLNQTLDWTNQANNMDLGGYNTRAGLAREQNAQDSYGLGLRQEQFNQGANWLQQQTAAQDRGAGALSGIGGLRSTDRDSAQGIWRADSATTPRNNWQTSYGIEAPNSGWGQRLVAGMANAFLPGSGGMIDPRAGEPAEQPYGGFGGAAGGTYGGGWGGNSNPYIFT
jgi:hypothetical protein